MKNHYCDSYNFDKKLNTERKSINILFFVTIMTNWNGHVLKLWNAS